MKISLSGWWGTSRASWTSWTRGECWSDKPRKHDTVILRPTQKATSLTPSPSHLMCLCLNYALGILLLWLARVSIVLTLFWKTLLLDNIFPYHHIGLHNAHNLRPNSITHFMHVEKGLDSPPEVKRAIKVDSGDSVILGVQTVEDK